MLELGEQAPDLHTQLGSLAAQTGIARLYASGKFAESVISGARSEGMSAACTLAGSREDILNDLIDWLAPGDWVLVKGSRGMAMEKVVAGLKEWAERKKR